MSHEYRHAFGYLRAFVVVLVLAHHALFAYNPVPPPAPSSLLEAPRWWRAFPVIDESRTAAAVVFNTFTDTFFMALLFFLSGLFVWQSLARKGSAAFVRDRAIRLGVPFAALVVLAPLSFYPAYLAMADRPSFGDYVGQWLALGEWPAGHAWFLWVLLAFSAAAALASWLAPGWAEALGRMIDPVLRHPLRLAAALILGSVLVYVPAAAAVGAAHWTIAGPFAVQTSRVLHYGLYFAAGILVGARGIGASGLGDAGRMRVRWAGWTAAAGGAFVLFVAAGAMSGAFGSAGAVARAGAYAVSCGATSFALIAIFLRFADRPSPLLDSLRDNAYGMYLIHFPVSNWAQYVLLGAALPALAKAGAAFTATLLLSWLASAWLRRVPGVARVI